LNPSAVGVFAWEIWSHKVFRWLMLPIILIAAIGCFVAFSAGLVYRIGALAFVATLIAAALGGLIKDPVGRWARLPHGLFYFYMVNLAAFFGIVMAIAGRVEVLWTPEREWGAPNG
jgi:hypothetical protein